MRIVSWNVNGIRAIVKKDFAQSFALLDADVMCFQETKAQCDQVFDTIGNIDGYELVSHSAVKKGYSGTAILSRVTPISVKYGIEYGEDIIASNDTDNVWTRGTGYDNGLASIGRDDASELNQKQS